MLITNSGVGGAERVFYSHAESFAQYFEVVECYFSIDNGVPPSGNPRVILDENKAHGLIDKVLNFFRRISKVRKLKMSGGFMACISHMEGANLVNVLSGDRYCKTITTIHGSLTMDQNRGKRAKRFFLNRVMVPYIYKRANVVVCVSNYIAFELQKLSGRTKMVYSIPNFFEPEKIQALSQEALDEQLRNLLMSSLPLVHVGRLAPEKNQVSLVKIYSALQSHYPSCKLFLIGEGRMDTLIVETARKSGLRCYQQNNGQILTQDYDVYLLGLKINPFSVLKYSKVFMLPSLNEGFPLVLVEAMICGIPVLSYDCISGPRQILAPEINQQTRLPGLHRGKYGYLMPPQGSNEISKKEIENWALAVKELLDSPAISRQLAENAKLRALDFSKDHVFEQWLSLIRPCQS